MLVETQEYLLDPSVFRRAANRTYWSQLWPVSITSLVGIVGFWVVRMPLFSFLSLVLAIVMPFVIARIKTKRAMDSPLNKIPYVTRFSDEGVEQLSEGERVAYVKYNAFSAFDPIPEGLRATLTTKTWILIPKAGFASDEDYREVCRYLVRIGKMRQGLAQY